MDFMMPHNSKLYSIRHKEAMPPPRVQQVRAIDHRFLLTIFCTKFHHQRRYLRNSICGFFTMKRGLCELLDLYIKFPRRRSHSTKY